MNLAEIVIVLLIAGAIALWLGNMSAREAGIRAVRAACAAEGVQLLDETIAIARMRPCRDRFGRLRWRRVYLFDYSDTGDNRHPGCVHLVGEDVTFLSLSRRLLH